MRQLWPLLLAVALMIFITYGMAMCSKRAEADMRKGPVHEEVNIERIGQIVRGQSIYRLVDVQNKVVCYFHSRTDLACVPYTRLGQ